MERSRWYEPKLDGSVDPTVTEAQSDGEYGNPHMPFRVPAGNDIFEPNLVGSLVEGEEYGSPRSFHMPMFDLDGIPVRVVPSSTPGNSHLYIDKPMSWTRYFRLLDAFLEAGLIERGWYDAAVAHRIAFVRLPGVQRNTPQLPIGDDSLSDEEVDEIREIANARGKLIREHRLNGESASSEAGHYPSTYFQRDPGDETHG